MKTKRVKGRGLNSICFCSDRSRGGKSPLQNVTPNGREKQGETRCRNIVVPSFAKKDSSQRSTSALARRVSAPHVFEGAPLLVTSTSCHFTFVFRRCFFSTGEH